MPGISDFFGEFTVLQPPADKPSPAQMHQRYMREEFGAPVSFGQRMQLEVTTMPCKVGQCPHPPGHHVGPLYDPDAGIDETAVGWTVQHVPGDLNRHKVLLGCILCGEKMLDLREHECLVWAQVAA